MLATEEPPADDTPVKEESSSPEDDPPPTVPRLQEDVVQEEDVEMEDVENTPSLPPNMSPEPEPTTQEVEEQLGAVGGKEQLGVVGGMTPMTPEVDQFLIRDDDEEHLSGAVTLSGAVAE